MSQYLVDQGIAVGSDEYKSLMQLGAALVGTAAGALATGDMKGASTAANAAFVGVTNNFLGHQDQARLNKLRNKKYDDLTTQEKQELAAFEQADQQSDYLLGMARRGETLSEAQTRQLDAYLYRYAQQDGLFAARALLEFGAPNVGNYGYAFALGQYQSEYHQKAKEAGLGRATFRSPGTNESFASWLTNPFTAQPTEESRYDQIVAEFGSDAARQYSFDMQLAQSVQDGLGLITAGGYARWLSGVTVLGFGAGAVGAGFDAAGQYTQNGKIRWEQSVVAGVTTAIGAQVAARGKLLIPLSGATDAATSTSFNNWYFDEDTNVYLAASLGAIFSGIAPPAGSLASNTTNRLLGNPMRYIPVSGPVQPMHIYRSNADFWAAVPRYAGTATSNTVGSLPAFIPLDNGKSGAQP